MRRGLAVLVGMTSACALFSDLEGFSKDVIIVEAEGGEAGVATEGGTPDASPAPDSAAPPDAGCQATFCDDFDTNPLGFDWETSMQGGGARAFDTVFFRSAPRGIAFSSTAPIDSTFRALQRKPFSATTKISISADVYVAQTAPSTYVDVIGFEGVRDTDGLDFFVYFQVDAATSSGQLWESVFAQPRVYAQHYAQHAALRWPVKGTWVRMTVTIRRDLATGATSLSTDIDGQPAVAETAMTWPMRFANAQIRPFIGLGYVNPPTAGWSVTYDDVAITAQ
jgi:hypothetical protein